MDTPNGWRSEGPSTWTKKEDRGEIAILSPELFANHSEVGRLHTHGGMT